MDTIPKKVHISWNDKDVLEHPSPLIQNGLRNLVAMNPDWEVTISDDADIDAQLQHYLPGDDYALIRDAHIVAKSDAWRLCKLLHEGGLYIDIDRFYNIPLADISTPETKWVLPTYQDYDFSQDFMLSSPGNPAFAETLRLQFERRRQGHQNIYLLGAQTYMHAVTTALTGRMINTDPGTDAFAEIRARLSTLPFIQTYRETSPYDTVVYRHDPERFQTDASNTTDWETLKREFYASYQVRHWTGEW